MAVNNGWPDCGPHSMHEVSVSIYIFAQWVVVVSTMYTVQLYWLLEICSTVYRSSRGITGEFSALSTDTLQVFGRLHRNTERKVICDLVRLDGMSVVARARVPRPGVCHVPCTNEPLPHKTRSVHGSQE